MKKWMTFDLDGTLMQNPFGEYVFPEINKLVDELKPGCIAASEMVRENERRMENSDYPAAYDWDDILNQYLLNQDIEATIDIEELVKKHSHTPKVHLLEDGILEVLGELKTRGFSLAVITNGFYKYQYPVMEALGLVDFFDEIITPDIVLCGKPDINMGKALTTSGTIVAHVGDRIDHDVVFAHQIGAKSVLINRKLPESIISYPPELRPVKLAELNKQHTMKEGDASFKGGTSNDMLPDVIISSLKEILLLGI